MWSVHFTIQYMSQFPQSGNPILVQGIYLHGDNVIFTNGEPPLIGTFKGAAADDILRIESN